MALTMQMPIMIPHPIIHWVSTFVRRMELVICSTFLSSGSLIRQWPIGESTTWKWNKVAQVFLGAGTFRLAFRLPEAGVQLDKVILSNDPAFVPE
jgi:hypothetical protein